MVFFPFAILGFIFAMSGINKSNQAMKRVDALQNEVDTLRALVEQLMAKA
jgi:hypothetical protein